MKKLILRKCVYCETQFQTYDKDKIFCLYGCELKFNNHIPHDIRHSCKGCTKKIFLDISFCSEPCKGKWDIRQKGIQERALEREKNKKPKKVYEKKKSPMPSWKKQECIEKVVQNQSWKTLTKWKKKKDIA